MKDDTEPDQKAAWGYVRISQESDASLKEQKASIREYARTTDLTLQTTRNDGSRTSGFNNDRDEYQLLKTKVRNNEIDAVITRDRARLSRDFDERLSLITLFRQTGVEWHVTEVGGRLGLDDPQNAMMEALHAGMDYYKKKIEIERSKKAIQKRKEQGFYQGRPPFGFEFDDAGEYIEPDDNFADALRVLELAESDMSQRAIAREVESVSKSTVKNIIDRAELYLEHADP